MNRTLMAALALMLVASANLVHAGDTVRRVIAKNSQGKPVVIGYVRQAASTKQAYVPARWYSGNGYSYLKTAHGKVLRAVRHSTNKCYAGPSSCSYGNRCGQHQQSSGYHYGQYYTGARYSTAPRPVGAGACSPTPYVGSVAPRYGAVSAAPRCGP